MTSKVLRVSDVIPETGIFPEYVRAAARITDANLISHVAAFLSILSTACCPHAHLLMRTSRDERRERLPMWTLIVGPSGSRKTTAVEKAAEMAEEIIGGKYRSPAGSREGIEEMVLAEPNALVLVPEAPQWFAANRAAYMRDGASMWCDLYDGKVRPRNLAATDKTHASTSYPCSISFLAAGATAKLMEVIRPSDWIGGLLSRVFIINVPEVDRERPLGFSWRKSVLETLREGLLDVIGVSKKAKVVLASAESRKVYEEWATYSSKRAKLLGDTHRILVNRLSHHVLRASALFALSRGAATVSTADMLRATALGDYSRDSVAGLDLP